MAFIVETIASDRRLQLAIEEIVRPMPIGVNWNKVRIGIRCALWGTATTSASAQGNIGLSMGVCQGSQGLFSPSTTDYIGAQIGGTSAFNDASLAYNIQSGIYYYLSQTQGANFLKKVGSTVTVSHISFTAGMIVAAPLTNRCQLFLDITKTSATQYTLSFWASNAAASVVTDVSQATFFLNMETEAAPSLLNNITTASLVSYTGAGLFDAVCVSWNKSSPTLEISDIAVCRFL